MRGTRRCTCNCADCLCTKFYCVNHFHQRKTGKHSEHPPGDTSSDDINSSIRYPPVPTSTPSTPTHRVFDNPKYSMKTFTRLIWKLSVPLEASYTIIMAYIYMTGLRTPCSGIKTGRPRPPLNPTILYAFGCGQVTPPWYYGRTHNWHCQAWLEIRMVYCFPNFYPPT